MNVKAVEFFNRAKGGKESMKGNLSQGVAGGLFLAFLFGSMCASGQGEPFPVRPITVYIGFAPGGFTPTTGQVVADGMRKYLNQPVLLNYKPGAVGAVAAEFVKNSKPDGYTLLYLAQGELIAKLAKDKKDGVPIKLQIDDLEALGSGPYSPNTIAVNADSAWKTIDEFVAAARKSPGSLNYASGGMGGASHIIMEIFSQKAGITLNHIPFPGGGPMVAALLGGHVQILGPSLATLGAHVKPGGGLRPLIVFDKKRDPNLPNVPTALERGFDIKLSSWQGLRGPKGLPKPARDSLVQAFEKTMKDPQVIQLLANLNASVDYLSPEEMDKKTRDDYKLFLDTWEKVKVN